MKTKLKTSLLVPILIFAGLTMSLFMGRTAHAFVWLNPQDTNNQIPDAYNDIIWDCDSDIHVWYGEMNWFGAWISAAGDSNQVGPIEVDYGTSTLGLQMNSAQVNCHNKDAGPGDPGTGGYYINQSQYNFKGYSTNPGGSIPGIIGDYSNIGFPFGGGDTKGSWTSGNYPFSYSPSGGFTTAGKYTITLSFRVTYGRTNGTFGCSVGTPIGSMTDDASCPQYDQEFSIYVNIRGCTDPTASNYNNGANIDNGSCKHSPIGNFDGTSCTSKVWEGWAYDPDSKSTSIQVHIYINGAFYAGVTTDQNRTDVNLAKNITGNHGFKVTVPDQYLYSAYTISIYAIGINSSGTQDGDNPQLSNSPKSYPACNRDPTGSIDASCNDAGTLVVSINVNDPDGGNMNYAIVIPTVGTLSGPPGGVNGAYAVGSWTGRPQDGVTQTVTGTVYDAQTGTGKTMTQDTFMCAPPPTISCRVSFAAVVEAGIADNFAPRFYVTDTSSGASGAISGGSAKLSLNGGPDSTGTFGALTRGVETEVSLSGVPQTLSTPGIFAVTSSANASSGSLTNLNSGQCGGPVTVKAASYPYVKAYGADVWAGGAFKQGTVCPAVTGGGIYAYAKKVGSDYQGSSGQFGVTALLSITTDSSIRGFYSSSTRSVANTPPKGTTFSNTAGSTEYGGAYGGTGACIPDYYTDTQGTIDGSQGSIAAVTNPSRPSGPHQYKLNNMNGGGVVDINKGYQTAVYIDQDVYIKDNIIYDTSARSTVNDIPFFALIVRGNIYIDPSVTRLEGLYIAQPKLGFETTTGRIYTCAPSGSPPTSGNLYDSCGNQLVVNGAFIAQQVRFTRAFKSLKDSRPDEKPYNFATGIGTNAAEVINFTPELFIAPSPLKDKDSATGPTSLSTYDAIYSLPPVF